MTEDDVGPITELEMVIGHFAGDDVRKGIMKGSEQIGDLSPEEVAEWLKKAVDTMDALVDENTRVTIMENCGFNCAEMNKSHIENALKKRKEFKTLDEFLEAEEKNPVKGTRLVRNGDMVYQYYDPSSLGMRCFCSLWRGLPDDEPVSLTFCQCSKGFVMKLWEAYVGRPVQVDLLESSISGAKECTFAIHL
ncbi:MAG: hypothetical protein HXS46_13705 [Theionarchaea archaeon]|nr:MAG: hypothetical protein AYK18_02665 [Theionarchaea archaeon DG-70]MBU7011738.1 hypothetical protein [Theionarchaea archaeon]